MIFPVSFPEARPVAVQIVQNRAWVNSGTINAEIWPLKSRITGGNSIGLPYKSSHRLFTLDNIDLNMRIVDGNNTYLVTDPSDWTSHREALLSKVIMYDSVSVSRYQATGTKPDGGIATNLLPITPPSSLPCTLIPGQGNVVVTTAGSTALVTLEMYCDLTDIKEKDIVTDLSTGSKYKVLNVKNYNQVCYMCVKLQGGVV